MFISVTTNHGNSSYINFNEVLRFTLINNHSTRITFLNKDHMDIPIEEFEKIKSKLIQLDAKMV